MLKKSVALLMACTGFVAVPALAYSSPTTISAPSKSLTNSSYTVSWGNKGPGAYYYLKEMNSATGSFTRKKYTSTSKSFTKSSESNWQYNVEWCLQPDGNAETCFGVSNLVTVDVQAPVGVPQILPFTEEFTSGDITVRWNKPEGTVKSYTLRKYHLKNSKFAVDEEQYTISNGAALEYVAGPFDTGTYRFDLKACNDFGCSAFGNDQNAKVMLRPQHVNDFDATLVGQHNRDVSLSWTRPDGNERVDKYRIRVKFPGDSSFSSYAYIQPDQTSYTVTGLGGGLHQFRVQACNSLCSEFDVGGAISLEIAKPTTAVVLGDSFSSGEGGRWKGNADWGYDNSYFGTNISATGISYEPESYDDNACHRALHAPIHSLSNEFEVTKNLACSGAKNSALWTEEEGGQRHQGQLSQISQLEQLVQTHDVKLIVVGIGGNDMGFSSLIIKCASEWVEDVLPGSSEGCGPDITQRVRNLKNVYAKAIKSVALIKRMMAEQGRELHFDYDILLMGYPSIVQSGSVNHRSPGAAGRLNEKCPFREIDLAKIEMRLMPALNGVFAAVAQEEDVNFMNIKNVFEGHKLCDATVNRAHETPITGAHNAEWVRFIDTDVSEAVLFVPVVGQLELVWELLKGTALNLGFSGPDFMGYQGRIQESMHPNYFGQQAVGQCLKKFWHTKGLLQGAQSFNCYSPFGLFQSTLEDVRVEQRPRFYTKTISPNLTVNPGAKVVFNVEMNFGINRGWNSLHTGSYSAKGTSLSETGIKLTLISPDHGERIELYTPDSGQSLSSAPLFIARGMFNSLEGRPFGDGVYQIEVENLNGSSLVQLDEFTLVLY